jgi:hypothetical protein
MFSILMAMVMWCFRMLCHSIFRITVSFGIMGRRTMVTRIRRMTFRLSVAVFRRLMPINRRQEFL